MPRMTWNSVRHALGVVPRRLGSAKPDADTALSLAEFSSLDEYRASQGRARPSRADREAIQRSILVGGREPFSVSGLCWVCGTESRFAVDFSRARKIGDTWIPNWRESLSCSGCGLNNRLRASLHLFHRHCHPSAKDSIYITEQTTPVYRWLSAKYPRVTGSEYLGDAIPFGQTDQRGIRNESLMRLTFPDARFDHLISFDVLEHIPQWQQALAECFRCLKPGGWLMLSVPFLEDAKETLVRARLLDNGEIEHILPAEYHGDPVRRAGCLCFYHFGWDLLTQLERAGFASPRAVFYWSRPYGYLGGKPVVFFARKPRRAWLDRRFAWRRIA